MKCILRTVASSLLVLHFVGILLVADALVLTVLFTVLGVSFRGKRYIIWILTPVLFLAFDYLTDSRYYRQLLTRFVPESHAVGALVYSAHFLILLRSVSVALCLADESHRISDGALEHGRIAPFRLWKTLWIVLEYAFYPYSFFFGPIIPFQDWLDFQDGETNPSCIRFAKLTGRIRPLTICSLLGRAVRLICWYNFWYFVLCFIYPNALFMYAYFQPSRGLNPWETAGFSAKPRAIVMAAHMAGVHFYMLHLLFYGIPGVLSDLELFLSSNRRNIVPSECATCPSCPVHHSSNSGKQGSTDSTSLSQARICLIPAPPSCVAHVALYSEMWRSFDRGLYNFLLRHVYHPLLHGIQTHQGLLRVVFHTSALVLPFVFVLVFHSFSYANVIWTVMNFIQLCAERILKWAFRQTHFGVLLRQTLSPSVLEYGVFFLKSLSWIFSLTAFIYFRFGYEVGMQFLYFAVFTPHILWSVFLFFAAQILSTEIVGRCGYAGFPIGFQSNNPSSP
ncbi:protein-cysteine N-palmitoyltransferase Rasp [Clonorchis sinensis]|nr:protein-cysteine N-palmitoyltransferase Rasp [Clonorchis sinensis]